MRTTSIAARRLLRESNPVPDDGFADAARSPSGQATLSAILTGPATVTEQGEKAGLGHVLHRRPVLAGPRRRTAMPAAVRSRPV